MELVEEVSFTDNSHIFGIPLVVSEGLSVTIEAPRKDVCLWVERLRERLPGIDSHIIYNEPQDN